MYNIITANIYVYSLNKMDLYPLLSGDDDVTYTSNILLLAAASFIACNTTLDFECVSIIWNKQHMRKFI